MRSTAAVSQARRRAARLVLELRRFLQPLLHHAILLRGTLYELRTRCGKPSCACMRQEHKRHRRWVLSYTVAGKKHLRVVPLDSLTQWQRWAANARQFRARRARIAEMTRQLLADLDVIERGQRRDPDR